MCNFVADKKRRTDGLPTKRPRDTGFECQYDSLDNLDIADRIMAYRVFEQTEEAQREELIKKIENSVKKMSLRELEALYYELSTKNYVNDN